MSYQSINNLYKNQDVLLFKRCYATLKVHGSSAHVSFKRLPNDIVEVRYFAGGESHERFKAIFDEEKLLSTFQGLQRDSLTIYGEVYGGKCQGMKDVYGPDLRFIAFEVLIGDRWLAVPQAHEIVEAFGLEFVPYEEGPTDLEWLDAQRDRPCRLAIRRGMGDNHQSEGIVIRPPIEVTKNNGNRIVAKHKTAKFRETKTPRQVDEASLKVLSDAEAVANEWVVEMRLSHVLSKLAANDSPATELKDTGRVATAMLEDVKKESTGEIVWSPEVEKAVKRRGAELFKARMTKVEAIGGSS